MPSSTIMRAIAAVPSMWAIASAALAGGLDTSEAEARFAARWFADDSAWNTPIAADAPTLEGSRGFLDAFLDSGARININREIWTPIVLYADETVPRCDLMWDRWRLADLPLHPLLARGAEFFASRKDTDASFCIYSTVNKSFYNLFAARVAENRGRRILRVGAGALFPVDGTGWWNNAAGPWSGRSSGASYCAGLIRFAEYESGKIEHALAMAWPSILVRSPRLPNAYVFPAKTSDGTGRAPLKAVPMGARLQLDPKLTDADLLKLGVDAHDLPVAHALQRYGSYLVDSSSVMAIYAESVFGHPDAPTMKGAGGFPQELLSHARFVAPGPPGRLDSRQSVGQPTLAANAPLPGKVCTFDPEIPEQKAQTD